MDQEALSPPAGLLDDPGLQGMIDLGQEPASRELTEPEREAFLTERRLAVLSITGEDGRPPLSMPIWYAYEPGGNLTFYTGVRSIKVRKTSLIKRHRMVTVVVYREDQPYRQVTVEGTVVQIDQPPQPQQMFAVARRYIPDEMAEAFVDSEIALAVREGDASTLVLFTVRPDRWLTMTY